MLAAHVQNAERMMTFAEAQDNGVRFVFADGCSGLVPFGDLPEIGNLSNLTRIELPNPYEVVLSNLNGEAVEIPWDFARGYCDPAHRVNAESRSVAGTNALGQKVRSLREVAALTQNSLADAAGIGRVTVVRIENGEQSPRYETLLALAKALGIEPGALLTPISMVE